MLPSITRICHNAECSRFEQPILLNDALNPGREAVRFQQLLKASSPPKCSECHHCAQIIITLRQMKFTGLEDYNRFMGRMMGMAIPLKKLIRHGLADENDLQQWDAVRMYLKDAYCPCCGYSTADLVKLSRKFQAKTS